MAGGVMFGPASSGGGGGGGNVALVFASAWTKTQGQSDGAARDTGGSTTPWTSTNGASIPFVISATGLSFPTANVLAVPLTGASCDVRVESATQSYWTHPTANGELVARRHYFRFHLPDSYGGQDFQSFHPFEPEPGACPFEWEYQVRINGNGTFDMQFKTAQPPDGQTGTDYITHGLNKDATYRAEVMHTRTSTLSVYKLQLRIYDDTNTLVKTNSDFTATSGAHNTLAADNPDCYVDHACVKSWNIGTNGPGGSWNALGSDCTVYLGAAAVSRQTWCGAYVSGEHA